MEIKDQKDKEKRALLKSQRARVSQLQQQRLEIFKQKEGQKLNLSIV